MKRLPEELEEELTITISQNPKVQRTAGWIIFGLFLTTVILSVFAMGRSGNNGTIELIQLPNPISEPYPTILSMPTAYPKTDCRVTINGQPAQILGNGVNQVRLHDEIGVTCSDTLGVENIFVTKDPDFGDSDLITVPRDSQIFTYKKFAKELGAIGDVPSISIHGSGEELDMYLFAIN